MEKITIGQFLEYTNVYVSVYIEDEFQRYRGMGSKTAVELLKVVKMFGQDTCPIDYIRNVDGGHLGDDKKRPNSIVLGIGIENYEKYFGKE